MFVLEERRETPVMGEYETVVLGGGPAGIAAAAASGRAGRSTILVERYGFLGGAGTAAGLANFCGLHAKVRGEHRQVVHGICDDILTRLERLGGLSEPHVIFDDRILAQAYDISAYKIAADELLLSAEVKLLFHAFAVAAVKFSNNEIEALIVETKSGRKAILGKVFIDCSGDGDLAAWAGAPYERGDGHGGMLYPTMMFRLNGVDPAAAGEAWTTIPVLMDEAERRGVKFPRQGAIVRPQKNPIEWRVNVTQMKKPDGSALDGTEADGLSAGEIEGRRQVMQFFEFLKREAPGFANSYVVDTPPQLGIRETRRITGPYQLSGEDVLTCASFSDTIGVNGWPIEAHKAGRVEWQWPPIPESRGFCQMPYRIILPQKVKNLLVAGRCASMTHEGQSAARVSGACFVMGQAAASAAHLALAGNSELAEISVEALQGLLEKNGAYLGRDVN
jgi:hypothetical protein